MTLHDTIRRELWHAYNWRETIERTVALTTAEQVVESGVAMIEKAVREALVREANAGRLHDDMSFEDERDLLLSIAEAITGEADHE